MKQHTTFIFDSYAWNPSTGVIELRYALDGAVRFTERITLPAGTAVPPDREEEFDLALFALHLAGGVSYYKTCIPKTIQIRSGTLTKKQATFWNEVYTKGLGEFFYRNDIDFRGLIDFPSHPHAEISPAPAIRDPSPSPSPSPCPRVLIPLGGGKDSVVTVELLRKEGANLTLFRMGGHPLIEEIARVAALPLLTVKRSLDAELFRLNEEGALNGHIPITAYLSCLTIVIALLHDFDAVAMSNERSANAGNVVFHGQEINHQWSKSAEFEAMFQEYLRRFITPRIRYFSTLRSMSELQIAEIFTRYPQYFRCTTSCNANWRILKEQPKELWCRKCPKCAFVFALYAAYLPPETVIEIFGKNLFEDKTLIPLYKELLGLEGFKPFECVGTPEETREAFALARKRGFLPPSL